jgi:hypothetical protein
MRPTKRRIRDAMADPGLVWITQGRTIENYVPPELLTAVLTKVYTKPLMPYIDRWSNVLRPIAEKPKSGPTRSRWRER